MDAQLKRGLTDACVLALLNQGDSYGYRLSQQAQDLMPLSETALYPVLKRLQEAQAVTTYTSEHGGRLRRYYQITQKGQEQIVSFLREWEQLGKVLAFIRQSQDAPKQEERPPEPQTDSAP